jgi:hypothetical protein
MEAMKMNHFNRTTRTIALAAGIMMVPTMMFAAEGKFDKTIPVGANLMASVSTGSGFIHIVPTSANEVHIIGHVHASHGWMGGSEDDVKAVEANPPIDLSGSTLRIGGRNEGPYRHVAIDYEITAPYSSQWKASTGSGDIKVSGVVAQKLETGSGEIEANNVTGDSILDTGSGDIHVAFAKSGMVKAETGSGSIHLENVEGGLKAETGSGDIKIIGKPHEDWKLETGSGSIDLGVGNAPLTLDAQSGSGSVTTTQTIAMTGNIMSKHHVMGNVNGGGPRVKAETGSGDIKLN